MPLVETDSDEYKELVEDGYRELGRTDDGLSMLVPSEVTH